MNKEHIILMKRIENKISRASALLNEAHMVGVLNEMDLGDGGRLKEISLASVGVMRSIEIKRKEMERAA